MSRLGTRLTAVFFPAVGHLLVTDCFGRRDGGIFVIPVDLRPQLQVLALFLFQRRFELIALLTLLSYLVQCGVPLSFRLYCTLFHLR